MKSLQLYHLVLVVAVYGKFAELVQSCETTSCPNGGTCISHNNCSCTTGYASPDCSDIDECILGTSGCEQTCKNTVGSFQCGCTEGYTLDTDGIHCLDDDECIYANFNCQHTCTNTHGSFTCSCDDGYFLTLNKRACGEIGDCPTEQPLCDHSCHYDVQVGSLVCYCYQGYELGIDGYTCTDVDECKNNNGNCEQVCSNLPWTHTCGCNTGYSLQTDGQTCKDIDNCVDVECHNGGTCVDGVASYTCTCVTGFTGQHCESDIDECETSTSGCQQACTNTVGSYNCFCYTGYLNFDRTSCIDIDDCIDVECQNGGTCVDVIDSYTCTCVTGFTGQHCQSDICTNTTGGFVCDCKGNRTIDTATALCVDQVSKHGKSEEQSKGSVLLIGLLVGVGVVISVVIVVIVTIRWKSRKRKLARTLQTEASFVSLSMVRPDVQRPGSSISQYKLHPFDRKRVSTGQDNPTFKFNLTFNVIKRISLDGRSEKDT